MKGFSTRDFIVVVVYLVAIAILGSSFYRKTNTAKDYFLGGRSISWIPAAISIIAADLSAITVMGVPAWTFRHNLELAWFSLSYLLTAPIVILVFLPFYAKLNLYTAYEYLEKRFNVSVRIAASGLFQILRCAHVAIALYAPSLVISLVTGLHVWQCIFLMGAFTTFYTTLGGMKAVIWTDVIQFTAVTLGVALIFCTAVSNVHGGLAVAYQTALENGRLAFLNFSADPKQLTSLWACVIGSTVLTLSSLTTDQALLQRLFATRSVRDCKQSIILQAIVNVPMALLLYFAGTVLYVFYFFNPSHLKGLSTPDGVVPFFAVHELPVGISGLVIASILAASMAVMSAGINALTTATTIDIYRRLFRPHESDANYAFVGKIGTAFWGTTATVFALFAGRLGALALAYNRINSFVCGPLLGVFLLGILTRRATPGGSLLGALAGVVGVSVMTFGTEWSFFFQAPVGLLITMIVGYLVSLLMRPPDVEKIRSYVLRDALKRSPIGNETDQRERTISN